MSHEHQEMDSFVDCIHVAIADQLRACRTPEQLLDLERMVSLKTDVGPLYRLICDFLRDRTVAPVEAASWMGTLMDNKEKELNACRSSNYVK
ncbi:hypothetical protein [Prochlorococcus sp. MIT 1300]|uniref:hypothetical protein n=1 Tax=Prochlorococcus sp. MIT 1300 TaxID=3096218 RepID=UPI002A7570BA|nr:hypothetical protein [Prochlorococcus sp. MIT 1300]